MLEWREQRWSKPWHHTSQHRP